MRKRLKKSPLPLFAPDATRGFVKFLSGEDLKKIGVKAMVVNTFHLSLQPGMEIVKKAGGIHKFMDWNELLFSDSGGYQVFSLIHKNPKMGAISGRGAVFRSPLDGARRELTPEDSIRIQFDLGTDVMICLDDCPPNDSPEEKIELAVERTVAWAERCRAEFDKQIKKRKIPAERRPLLFGVIQGGEIPCLRKKCAEGLIKIGFDGYGFGARHVDAKGKFLSKIIEYTASLIPEDKYRFALGVGLPEDIMRCAAVGWEIFDCVIPTREGRHGKLFFKKNKPALTLTTGNKYPYETLNINNAKYAKDFSPVNGSSSISELREVSRAYLHHLFRSGDPRAGRLASLNNLEFYSDLIGLLSHKRERGAE